MPQKFRRFGSNCAPSRADTVRPLIVPHFPKRRSRIRVHRVGFTETMRLALFEPDIPQNAAALIRLGACLGVPVDVIEPCGFLFSEAAFRRAGMDYLSKAEVLRHLSWSAFAVQVPGRLVLLTTKGSLSYTAFAFMGNDTILVGRESAGVPDEVHGRADARLRIPVRSGLRSLNVAQAGAMVLGEALRQTKGFPS
jgi:tRNA (cytidine/uridine-2'-O-)-methyltransferase